MQTTATSLKNVSSSSKFHHLRFYVIFYLIIEIESNFHHVSISSLSTSNAVVADKNNSFYPLSISSCVCYFDEHHSNVNGADKRILSSEFINLHL